MELVRITTDRTVIPCLPHVVPPPFEFVYALHIANHTQCIYIIISIAIITTIFTLTSHYYSAHLDIGQCLCSYKMYNPQPLFRQYISPS